MISTAAAAKLGDNLAQSPVGTGPFVIKSWTPGQQIVVERNPDYWEPGKPYLDRVVFMLISNAALGIPRLITREVDFVGALTPVDIRPLEKQSGIALSQSPGSRWLALQMRVDRVPYDNPKLRQAMAHAIDRQRMVDIVMNGKATIAEGFTPPGMWWFDETLKSYPYDPDRAKALIAEIGPAAQVDMPLSVQPVQLYQQISQLAQEQLKSVGLKVEHQAGFGERLVSAAHQRRDQLPADPLDPASRSGRPVHLSVPQQVRGEYQPLCQPGGRSPAR